ncbi:hypothetical protein [Ectobacillus ponti]|uniref:VCBS repeat-containing protein n=1 Tax=Ectobacillus ponti TaxID=2961894 RepID=A0AA41X9V2_9BACI|nr:hypothetical protein [Ectobacillus ponti]MCP8968071.1 hypothetical protein [Ectobacillus ponti]
MTRNLWMALVILLLGTAGKAEASERVVLTSVPSEAWHQRIYLMADQITWMDYRNVTVQVGDMGQVLYHFPHWRHGKYEPKLYAADVSGDALEDIIIVLNRDRPRRDLHILNRIAGHGYEEAKIEPPQQTIAQQVKMQKNGKLVTVQIGKQTYTADLSSYDYVNPREPFLLAFELTDYAVQNGQLLGAVPVYAEQDAATGGLIGYLKLLYTWDGKKYTVGSMSFVPYDPKDDLFFFPS